MPIINPGGGGGTNPPFIPYTMVFTVTLPNLPEWAIPMIKVIPRCYVDDGYYLSASTDQQGSHIQISSPLANLSFNLQCQHIWTVSPNKDSQGNTLDPTVILQVMIYASATNLAVTPNAIIPTYIDVDLVFLNERAYNEINTNKV